MNARTAAEYDTPLAKKHHETPRPAITRPAIAGPITQAAMNIALLRLTALLTCSVPTISTTSAAGRVVEGVHGPETEREHEDHPQLDDAEGGDRPENQSEHAGGGLPSASSRRLSARSATRPPRRRAGQV